MLSCDVMLANISKFREQGTMSNAHAVLYLSQATIRKHGTDRDCIAYWLEFDL